MSVKKITVVGGTGYAGSAIVKEAVARGHSVVAVSRSRAAAPIDGVSYVASPAAEATAAIADADVVVAALSPRGDSLGTLPGIYKKLGRQAAKNNARFVVVGGFTCLRPAPGAPRIIEGGDIPSEYAAEALEMFAVLKELLADETGADWLFVSPGLEFSAVTPGEDLGHYRVGDDVALFDENGKSAISGVDFARAVLDEIETPTRHHAQIHFAY